LGIDFIQKHQLWYCPKNQSFTWEGQPNWGQEHLKVCNATIIPPLSVAYLKATICTEGGTLPGEGNLCIATVASSQHPLVTAGPYLVQPDTQGQITIAVKIAHLWISMCSEMTSSAASKTSRTARPGK
jgi:hypothetical protein